MPELYAYAMAGILIRNWLWWIPLDSPQQPERHHSIASYPGPHTERDYEANHKSMLATVAIFVSLLHLQNYYTPGIGKIVPRNVITLLV